MALVRVPGNEDVGAAEVDEAADEILRAGERAGLKEIDDAEQVRLTGGVAPAKQVELAMFLASDKSNHISGKMIHVNDDWKKLRDNNMHPEAYTLRRVLKV